MDLISKVDKALKQTTELRAEVSQIKELVQKQHEIILRLLQSRETYKDESPAFSPTPKTTDTDIVDIVSSPSPAILPWHDYFPLETQEDLDNFEKMLDDANIEEMVVMTKSVFLPGKRVFKKNLSRILSPKVVMEYNVDGWGGKKRLRNYPKLLDLLYKATLRDGWTYKMFLDDLRFGFKYAKDQEFKKNKWEKYWLTQKRKNVNNEETSEDSDVQEVEEITMPY